MVVVRVGEERGRVAVSPEKFCLSGGARVVHINKVRGTHLRQCDSYRKWLYDQANLRVRAVIDSLAHVGHDVPRPLQTPHDG